MTALFFRVMRRTGANTGEEIGGWVSEEDAKLRASSLAHAHPGERYAVVELVFRHFYGVEETK